VSWGNAGILYLLWGLPVVVILLAFLGRRRRTLVARLGVLVSPDERRRTALRHRFRAILHVLALVLVVFALAQPRWGFRWQDLHREGLELVVVLDVSSSMDAQDVSPSRLERAKRKIFDLSELLTGDKVGMVLFAGGAFPRMPLTLDYTALRDLAADTSSQTLVAQGSDLGAALDVARSLLAGEGQADKAILVLSDGEDQIGKAREAADRAAAEGIHLYAIGVGTVEGAPVPQAGGGFKKDSSGERVLSRLDEKVLQEIAARGSGAYVQSTAGPADIQGIFRDEIKGKLQSAETGVRREKIWDERFQWPLALAFASFVWAESIERFLFRRRPRKGSSPLGILALLVATLSILPRAGRAELPPEVQRLLQEQVRDPDDLDLAERVGEALYQAGEYDRAREVLADVAERATEPEQRTRARYNAGLSAYRSGHLTEAIEDWDGALQSKADHEPSRQNLTAAQKELAARLQEEQQDQQKSDSQSQEDNSEPQEQEASQDQESESEQQQKDPGQEQDQQNADDGTNEAEAESEPEGKPGDRGDVEPRDGTKDTGQGDGSGGVPTEEDLSKDEAKRFLNGLEEGNPRVPVSQRQGGGRDW
jgi:Ca-activated chloride channel homolog